MVRKKTKVLCSIVCIVSFFFTFSLSALASPLEVAKSSPKAWGSHRIHGQDRFETSFSVANELNANAQVQNIILASGYSFPDALAASTLASKLKAPIILAGPGVKDSMASLNYVKEHLVSGGTVTIIGGGGVISHKVGEWLLDNGFKVNRFGGSDRFATNDLIVKELNVAQGTPVIITNSENFPDALGISSLAASKGWPILLSNPGNLSPSVQAFLASDKPTTVYIVGGEGVMRENVIEQIKTLSPGTQIQRLGGNDRFETLSKILNMFYPHPTQIYVANGDDFADALSGSPLAASHNAPILLVNPKSKQLPQSIENYLITLRNNNVQPQVNVLGGDSAVPERLLDQINDILQSDSVTTTPSTIDETMWVSNPSTTGFTVTVSPALYGLNVSNFILRDGNTSVGISLGSITNNGSTYQIVAALAAGKTYTLKVVKDSYNFGIAQYVVVPSAPTVSRAVTAGNMHIILTMSSELTGQIGSSAAFSIAGVASHPTVANVTVDGTTVVLTLSSPIVSSDSSIRVSYTRTGVNDLTNGAPVRNFGSFAVNNNL